MNCKQILKHIDDYRSGNLDEVLNQMVEIHIQHCPDCRRVMESEQSVSEFLKKAEESPSEISVAGVLLKRLADIDREARIKAKPDQERFKDARFKWILIVSFLLGLGLIGIMVIPFDSRLDQHNVGPRSGPGYTWMGNIPIEDPLETWWHDPSLSNQEYSPQRDLYEKPQDLSEPGRIIHVLDFDETTDPSPKKLEENL